jgi:hypothetical protein
VEENLRGPTPTPTPLTARGQAASTPEDRPASAPGGPLRVLFVFRAKADSPTAAVPPTIAVPPPAQPAAAQPATAPTSVGGPDRSE